MFNKAYLIISALRRVLLPFSMLHGSSVALALPQVESSIKRMQGLRRLASSIPWSMFFASLTKILVRDVVRLLHYGDLKLS